MGQTIERRAELLAATGLEAGVGVETAVIGELNLTPLARRKRFLLEKERECYRHKRLQVKPVLMGGANARQMHYDTPCYFHPQEKVAIDCVTHKTLK